MTTQNEIAKRGGQWHEFEREARAAMRNYASGGERVNYPTQPERLTWNELLSAASELLELLRDGYWDDATITAAIERLENAVNAVTASKIAPSPAGSWRRAGGVLSKSQGQQ